MHPSTFNTKAYSAASATSPLASTTDQSSRSNRTRRPDRNLFCGICHSDLHQVRNEWSGVCHGLPDVPGHEIVGRVTKVGSAVNKFKPGDLAAVGCLVDSDRTCPNAKRALSSSVRT